MKKKLSYFRNLCYNFKNLSFIFLLPFLLMGCMGAKSDCIKNEDQERNCNMLTDGTFIELDKECNEVKGKTIIFSEGFVIEKDKDGKQVFKAKREWSSDCGWNALLIESSDNENAPIGSQVVTYVVETEGDLVMLKYQIKQYGFYQMYKKIK